MSLITRLKHAKYCEMWRACGKVSEHRSHLRRCGRLKGRYRKSELWQTSRTMLKRSALQLRLGTSSRRGRKTTAEAHTGSPYWNECNDVWWCMMYVVCCMIMYDYDVFGFLPDSKGQDLFWVSFFILRMHLGIFGQSALQRDSSWSRWHREISCSPSFCTTWSIWWSAQQSCLRGESVKFHDFYWFPELICWSMITPVFRISSG